MGLGGWEGLLATAGHLFLPTVTPSDCYVTLWLPTACSHRLQTRTVKNSSSPVWNQSFHFRIHRQLKVGQASALALPTSPPAAAAALLTFPSPPSCSPVTLPLQNVVELKVFDQDLVTGDDPVLSVLFDAGTLRAGEFRHESFSLNPQARRCFHGSPSWCPG